MSHDEKNAIRQQFNRRFAFGLHAAVSGLISLLMLYIALTNPETTTSSTVG